MKFFDFFEWDIFVSEYWVDIFLIMVGWFKDEKYCIFYKNGEYFFLRVLVKEDLVNEFFLYVVLV